MNAALILHVSLAMELVNISMVTLSDKLYLLIYLLRFDVRKFKDISLGLHARHTFLRCLNCLSIGRYFHQHFSVGSTPLASDEPSMPLDSD